MVFIRNSVRFSVGLGLILATFFANADVVRGPISDLQVKTVGKGSVRIFIQLNEGDRGTCGNAKFEITDPNWKDVDRLQKAVASGDELTIGYRCEGRKNRI